MAWKKADPKDVERFTQALPKHAHAIPRKMFGYPACFVNGHFFTGLHEDNVVLRLPGNLKPKLGGLADACVFDPMRTGRGMKDWWVIPPAIARDNQALTRLLGAAFIEIDKLPPKIPAPKRADKAAPARSSRTSRAAKR